MSMNHCPPKSKQMEKDNVLDIHFPWLVNLVYSVVDTDELATRFKRSSYFRQFHPRSGLTYACFSVCNSIVLDKTLETVTLRSWITGAVKDMLRLSNTPDNGTVDEFLPRFHNADYYCMQPVKYSLMPFLDKTIPIQKLIPPPDPKSVNAEQYLVKLVCKFVGKFEFPTGRMPPTIEERYAAKERFIRLTVDMTRFLIFSTIDLHSAVVDSLTAVPSSSGHEEEIPGCYVVSKMVYEIRKYYNYKNGVDVHEIHKFMEKYERPDCYQEVGRIAQIYTDCLNEAQKIIMEHELSGKEPKDSDDIIAQKSFTVNM